MATLRRVVSAFTFTALPGLALLAAGCMADNSATVPGGSGASTGSVGTGGGSAASTGGVSGGSGGSPVDTGTGG